jgi:hypothetical protein
VILEDGKGQVVEVTSPSKKRGRVIASCAVKTIVSNSSYRFTTASGFIGHRELCQLLYENGVHGSYSEWLRAVNAGDEQKAEDKEGQSAIGFECDVVSEEEAVAWEIKPREESVVESQQKHEEDNTEREKEEPKESFATLFHKAFTEKEEAKENPEADIKRKPEESFEEWCKRICANIDKRLKEGKTKKYIPKKNRFKRY